MNRRELLESAGAVSLLTACNAFAASMPMRLTPAFDAQLQLGPAQSGKECRRWARIVGGSITGMALRGTVRAGQMQWLVDPASGAVELSLTCSVEQSRGAPLELRDRSVHSSEIDGGLLPGGLHTAPELHQAAGRATIAASLVGRLDVGEFARGLVRLRAFERG